MPNTSCGRFVNAPMVVMEIDDVLDVRMTSGRVIASSFVKIDFFTSRFSTTASTT
jgi:hypothetical protein